MYIEGLINLKLNINKKIFWKSGLEKCEIRVSRKKDKNKKS